MLEKRYMFQTFIFGIDVNFGVKLVGGNIQFDYSNMFQPGWNHQLDVSAVTKMIDKITTSPFNSTKLEIYLGEGTWDNVDVGHVNMEDSPGRYIDFWTINMSTVFFSAAQPTNIFTVHFVHQRVLQMRLGGTMFGGLEA